MKFNKYKITYRKYGLTGCVYFHAISESAVYEAVKKYPYHFPTFRYEEIEKIEIA